MNDDAVGNPMRRLAAMMDTKLSGLAAARLEPGDAADWAMAVLNELDDDADVDVDVMDALDHLAGADLLSAPGVYLHGPDDFRDWLTQFRAGGTFEDIS